MTALYDLYEASQFAGRPVEAFLFTGTFKSYRYTSADVAVTINGNVFQPIPIRRSTIRAGTSAEDSLDLEVRLPVDVALVKDYAFGIAPPALDVTVYRLHRGTDQAVDFAIYWSGRITGLNIDGHEARVRIPSIFGNMLAGELPSVYYQVPCNHVLFDGRCQVSRNANSISTTVTGISDYIVEVTSLGAFSATHFIGGELVSSAGERRMIVAQSGNALTINFPFAGLQIGMTVTAAAGCDHSPSTCKAKFNNKINFGGFEYVPASNPFSEGL